MKAELVLKKIWETYGVLKNQPNNNVGAKRWIGVLLYLTFFGLASVMSALWFLDKDSATKVAYKKLDRYTMKRLPDLIICPSEKPTSKYKFNAVYHDHTIEKVLGMKVTEVDELMGLYRENCLEEETGCPPLTQACSKTKFAKYCNKLEKAYEGEVKTMDDYYKFARRVLLKAQERGENPWSLQTLLGSLLSYRPMSEVFNVTYENFLKIARLESDFKLVDKNMNWDMKQISFPTCHFYTDIGYDTKRNEQCSKAIKFIWIETRLCTTILGNELNETKTTFYGIQTTTDSADKSDIECQIDYWMGNLDVTSFEPSMMVTNKQMPRQGKPRAIISGVPNWRVIKFVDHAGLKKSCVKQKFIKGLKVPCRGLEDSTWRYYTFSYQKRRLATIWPSPKGVDLYIRRFSFTTYSRFQIAAGMFGCLIGFSLMQWIEFGLAVITIIKPAFRRPADIAQIIAGFLLVILTVVMTVMDIDTYVKTRFTAEFAVSESQYPLPRIRLCNNPNYRTPTPSFINVTKIKEFGMSPALYQYFLHSAWRQADPPHPPYPHMLVEENGITKKVFPKWVFRNWSPKPPHKYPCKKFHRYYSKRYEFECYNPVTPLHLNLIAHKYMKQNITQARTAVFIRKLHKEAEKVYKRMGIHKEDATFNTISSFFNLDPRLLIKTCKIGSNKISDCGKYARYQIGGSAFSMCLDITIPATEVPENTERLGIGNGLEIVYDTKVYREHSDFNRYFGPGMDDLIQANINYTQCKLMINDKLHFWEPSMSPYFREEIKQNVTLKVARPNTKGQPLQFCGRSTSWVVHVEDQKWSLAPARIATNPDGLSYRSHYAMDLSEEFEEQIPRSSADCTPNDEIECSRPRVTVDGLVKALMHYKLCGCAACLNNYSEVQEKLKIVLGKSPKCCTPKDHWECFLAKQEKLKWNADKKEYIDLDSPYTGQLIERRLVVADKHISKPPLFFQQMTPESLAKYFFKVTGPFDEKVMTRLSDLIRKCFAIPCKRRSLDMNSVQAFDPRPNEWILKVFYSRKISYGLKERDSLEPAQATAVFICGYTVTFGISLMAFVHIFYQATTGSQSNFTGTMEKVHSYWLRTIGVVLVMKRTENQITPAEVPPQANGEEAEDASVATSSGTGKPTNKVTDKNSAVLDAVSAASSAGTEKPTDELNVNLAVDHEGGQSPETSRSCQNSKPPMPAKGSKKVGRALVNPAESFEAKARKERKVMVPTLLAMFAITGCLIIFFFIYVEFYAYTADVILEPIYQRPSLFLCGKNPEEFVKLTHELDSGFCWLDSNRVECRGLFKTMVKAADGSEACWMWDNTNTWTKLKDPENHQIKITLRKDFKLMYELMSTNGTALKDFAAFEQWQDNSIQLDYTVTLRKQIRNCMPNIERKNCERCPSNLDLGFLPAPGTCCLEDNMVAPAFIDGLPCQQYEFLSVKSAQKVSKDEKFKTMTIKPANMHMTVLAGTRRQTFFSIFSVVGGFVGGFIGLDLLNVVSHCVFSLMDGMKKVKFRNTAARVEA